MAPRECSKSTEELKSPKTKFSLKNASLVIYEIILFAEPFIHFHFQIPAEVLIKNNTYSRGGRFSIYYIGLNLNRRKVKWSPGAVGNEICRFEVIKVQIH